MTKQRNLPIGAADAAQPGYPATAELSGVSVMATLPEIARRRPPAGSGDGHCTIVVHARQFKMGRLCRNMYVGSFPARDMVNDDGRDDPDRCGAPMKPSASPGAGGDVARARPFGRDRGLHPQLSPSAASAADAGIARRPAHRSPLRGRHCRKRRRRVRQRARCRRISPRRQISRAVRDRAEARQLPRDQCRVRDRDGDVSRRRTIS